MIIYMDSVIVIKIISAFLYPLGLIALSGLSCVFFRYRKRVRLSRFSGLTMVLIFFLSTNPFFSSWLASQLENQYPQRPLHEIVKHDAIIVLGGGLRIPLKPAEHTQLGAAADRYWYATLLYRAGKAKHIILSGGNIYPHENMQGEAYYAKQLLQQWGVPSDAILIETQSRTTVENQRSVTQLLNGLDIQSALLVTSALHMPRAYTLFRQLPIKVTPASADVLVRKVESPEVFSRWIPSAQALNLITSTLHEYYGSWFNELNAFIDSF